MKTIKRLIAGVGLCAALVFTVPEAKADGSLNLFGITNNLQGAASAVVIYNYPTNYANPTNGFGQLTGHGLPIGKFDSLGVNLQGFLVNTGAASHVTFGFVSSCASGPPQITVGTNLLSVNQTVLLQNDWTSTNNVVMLDIPIPATTTNWYNWTTNFVGPGAYPFINANWIGVMYISNYLTAACELTNAQLGINTKIVNRAFIGN